MTPSCICLMCLYCIHNVSHCSIKSCGRSWSANKGNIYAFTKALEWNIVQVLTTVISLSFCQKLFFLNQTPSCICSMCLYCIGKVSNCSKKSCGKLISPWRHHLCIYKSLIREKLSKFSQLSFCQKLFFLDQTPSCICSMCLQCIGKVSICSIKSCGRSWLAHVWTIIA